MAPLMPLLGKPTKLKSLSMYHVCVIFIKVIYCLAIRKVLQDLDETSLHTVDILKYFVVSLKILLIVLFN